MDKPVDLWTYERQYRKVPDAIIRMLADDWAAMQVYLQILLRARWTPGWAKGSHGLVWLEAGQAIIGRGELATIIHAKGATVRGALDRLSKLRILAIEGTKLGSKVTLVNYGENAETAGDNSPSEGSETRHQNTTDSPTKRPNLATNVEEIEDLEGKEERGAPSLDSLRVIREAYEHGYRKAHKLSEGTRVEWTSARHQKPLENLLRSRTQEEILGALLVMFTDPPDWPTGRDIATLEKFPDKFQGKPATYDPTGRNGIRISTYLGGSKPSEPRTMFVGGKEYVLPDDDTPITGIGDMCAREILREQLEEAREAERRAQAAEMLKGFEDARAELDAAMEDE